MSVNSRLVLETVILYMLTAFAAVALHEAAFSDGLRWTLYIPLLLFQGLWLYRCYIVGHEAAHKKLFPKNPLLNDFLGGIVLLPLMVPITIYRKIHYFHHGFNRKDDHTSALDTFVIRGKVTMLKKAWCYLLWYLSVFFGGFFLHSFVSVVLFLFVPPSWSRRISPAFNQWTVRDQIIAVLLFLLGVLFHYIIYFLFGLDVYLFALGFPLLSFAWVLSLLLYIFHYDTTKGGEVRYNVRSVRPVPVLSWILMNFNEHATHHQYPNIPWYDLPAHRRNLPEPYNQQNQQTDQFFVAIFNQLKGPLIVYENKD